jgi:hypothetical protein
VLRSIPACEDAVQRAGGVVTAVCDTATELCSHTPDPNDAMYWVFRVPSVPNPSVDAWVWVGQHCMAASDAERAPLPALSLEAFQRLPLPPGGIRIQPPTLRTLVNVPTNVFVDARPIVLPTTLLGFPVRVRATPVRFRWTFGDGRTLETTDPGAAYPDIRTAHTYVAPGRVTVGLRTVYAGEYSVAGGPWLAVQGEAVVDSPPVSLTVLTARTELVAGP